MTAPFVRHYVKGTPVNIAAGYAEATVPTIRSGDMVLVLEVGNYGTRHQGLTSMEGLGGTWVKDPVLGTDRERPVFQMWVCTDPVSSCSPQTITGRDATYEEGSINRSLQVLVIHGLSTVGGYEVVGARQAAATASASAGAGEMFLGVGYSNTAAGSVVSTVPGEGFVAGGPVDLYEGRRWAQLVWRFPDASSASSVTAARPTDHAYALAVRLTGPALPVDPEERPCAVSGVSVYDGTAWSARPVKVFDGTAWTPATVARFDGSAWL